MPALCLPSCGSRTQTLSCLVSTSRLRPPASGASMTLQAPTLRLGTSWALNRRRYVPILVLDVLEHVRDPLAFLSGLRGAARHYVLHIPLDLSAQTVVREQPILNVRRKVGHIHYFTKSIALSLIQECGFRVIDWRYSGAAFNGPRRTRKTRAAMSARWLAQQLSRDWAVRMLGGETLVVLAEEAVPRSTGEKPQNGG